MPYNEKGHRGGVLTVPKKAVFPVEISDRPDVKNFPKKVGVPPAQENFSFYQGE